VKFVLEHSLSPRLSNALAALEGEDGEEVEHLRDRNIPQETLDEVWLPRLARDAPDCIVITADPRITRGAHERAAWLEAGLTTVFLRSFADLPFDEQAARLVRWWPEIRKRAKRAKRGAGLVVSVNGRIEELE